MFSTPLQSITDAHIIGHKAGKQLGDLSSSTMNFSFSLSTGLITGQHLNDLRNKSRIFVLNMLKDNIIFNVDHISLFHSFCCVLKEGVHIFDQESIDDIPGKKSIFVKPKNRNENTLRLVDKIYGILMTFLFRQFDDPTVDHIGFLSDLLSAKKIQLWSLVLLGLYFEGLTAFELARRPNQQSLKWISKGESILASMQQWNEHCTWNYENKMMLLEAEKWFALGEHDKAERLYLSAIKSANLHKFVHEEAVAAELAGQFFYQTGNRERLKSFFIHAVECYKKWEAFAVARRLEGSIQNMFGLDDLETARELPPFGLSSKAGSLKHGRT